LSGWKRWDVVVKRQCRVASSRANNGSCERTAKFGAEENVVELLELLRERREKLRGRKICERREKLRGGK